MLFSHINTAENVYFEKGLWLDIFMGTHLRPFNCTKHRKMCSHAPLPYSFCDTFYFVVFLVWQQLLDWTCFCWKLPRAMSMSRINKLHQNSSCDTAYYHSSRLKICNMCRIIKCLIREKTIFRPEQIYKHTFIYRFE